MRPHYTKIEGDREEYASVDYISDVKIDNWPRRRGPYVKFLTHFVSFDIPEWLLLEQVDDGEQLSFFWAAKNGILSLREKTIWTLRTNSQ